MPASSGIVDAITRGLKNDDVQRGLLGAGAGALVGRYGTPHAFGYADNPAAVNMSTFLDSILGGAVGVMGKKGIKSLVQNARSGDPGALLTVAGIPAAELAPVSMDLLTKGRGAVTQGSESMRELAEASKGIRPNPSISDQVRSALTSRAGKGALTGAAVAGLGAMTSGLTRAKSQSELLEDRSRGGMVASDFMKYLIPALVAGGTIGHLTKRESA